MSGKCPKEKCLGGNVPSRRHCPFSGVFVWSTEIVDGRPRVLHLQRSIASWMNDIVYYTLVAVAKMCALNKEKWLLWQRPLSDRRPILEQSSMPVGLSILKIGRGVHFEEAG